MHIVNKFCLCPMQWGFTEQCWIVWDLTLDYMRLLDYEVTLVILLYGDYTSLDGWIRENGVLSIFWIACGSTKPYNSGEPLASMHCKQDKVCTTGLHNRDRVTREFTVKLGSLSH